MLDQLKPLLGKLALFSQERMGFKHPPKLFLRNDSTNSQQALGKTAFYNPEEQSVTLFVHGRHPKDILRSFAHELVHHTQNLRGDLTSEKMGEMGSNYAQDNEHLRNMEKEAYLDGNMCFRDWEDTIEDKDLILIKLAESKFLKENKTMTTKITKEFLKDTIRNVLMERMSDEDFVAYAQRNKYARDTQAYRNAVARIQKKKEMAAAKAAQPSKLQQGIASLMSQKQKKSIKRKMKKSLKIYLKKEKKTVLKSLQQTSVKVDVQVHMLQESAVKNVGIWKSLIPSKRVVVANVEPQSVLAR
jgi:hypothetical protein